MACMLFRLCCYAAALCVLLFAVCVPASQIAFPTATDNLFSLQTSWILKELLYGIRVVYMLTNKQLMGY